MTRRWPTSCSRRGFLAGGLALLASPLGADVGARVAPVARPIAPRARTRQAQADLRALEARTRGRLGVTLLDAGGRAWLEQRAGERFPMCSTFKWLLAGQVLARVDAGDESLARVVPYGEADLLEYAPVTRANVDRGGLTIEELCDAAVRRSDNTAANLLVATVGGPPGFTRYARALGDEVTRLDRLEPQLNAAEPGDSRDTTTPAAMAANLRRVLLGDALSDGSRERLIGWMIASTTGATKLRAGFPDDWRAGDKSGMGARGATNDVAIAWPPGRPPVLIAAYLVESDAPVEVRNAALADVGRIVGRMIDGDP